MKPQPDWYVYLLECGDGTIYCGIAKDVDARLLQHREGKGARYTRGRGPIALLWQRDQPLSHSEALKLERAIKKLPRAKKLNLARKE